LLLLLGLHQHLFVLLLLFFILTVVDDDSLVVIATGCILGDRTEGGRRRKRGTISRRRGRGKNLLLLLLLLLLNTRDILLISRNKLLVVHVHIVVVVMILQKSPRVEGLGNLSGNAGEQEQRLKLGSLSIMIDLEGFLNFRIRERTGKRDETNIARVLINGDEGTLVEALDDVGDILKGMNVDPGTALSTTSVRISVGLDEDSRSRKIRTQDFNHLGNDVLSTFLAQLADENAEGGSITVADAALAVVAEGVVVAEGTLPGDLTAEGLVGLGFD